VKGQVPQEIVDAAEAYQKLRLDGCMCSTDAFSQLGTLRAYDGYMEVLDLFIASDECQALHAIECPNCPWDGETIFSEGALS